MDRGAWRTAVPGIEKSRTRLKRLSSSSSSSSLCYTVGFPGDTVKNTPADAGNIRDAGSVPGLGRSPGGGHGNPLQYSCLESPHGQRSLAGCSPWCREELGMTEHSTVHTYISHLLYPFICQLTFRLLPCLDCFE